MSRERERKRTPPRSVADTAAFCRSMAMLLRAGVSGADSLYLLAEDAPDGRERQRLKEMAARADAGLRPSEAVRESGSFPAFVPRMMAVGEETGHAEETLEALADYYEGRLRLDGQLRSAVLYPSVLLTVLLAVLTVLVAYVLPVFSEVYARLGTGFTGVARGLLVFGGGLSRAMPAVCALLGAVTAFLLAFALRERFRAGVLRRLGTLTGKRGAARLTASAAFLQALSLGVSSGMGTAEAARLSATLMETPDGKRCAARCEALLERGDSLAQALCAAGLLRASEGRILAAAERGGAGERALKYAAQSVTAQSGERVEKLLGCVEPTMVLVGAALVGVILLSVMLPLLHILSAIG